MVQTNFSDEAKLFLEELEGRKLKPYFDTEGNVSFGVGRNLVSNPLTPSEKEFGKKVGFSSSLFVDHLFWNDFRKVSDDLDNNFTWWKDLSKGRRLALLSMRFQFGPANFRQFRPSLDLLRVGEYDEVAKHLKNTKWAKQTPSRVEKTIQMILEG